MTVRVYLISCCGRPNFGDEFITACWLKFIYTYYPHYEVWLDSPEPGNAQVLFRKYHPHVKVINTLWKLCWRNQRDPQQSYQNIFNNINYFGSPDIDLNIDIFRSSNIVHILGGGYINSKWKENYSILFAASVLREISDVKIYATGLSLFPHEDYFDRARLSNCLSSFSHISVRDDVSAGLFDLENKGDDAFLGIQLNLYPISDNSNCPDILCCIQSELADENKFSSLVDRTCSYLLEQQQQGKKIGYFEAIPGADSFAFHKLQEKIDGIAFYPFASVWGNGLPANHRTEIISTRFHHHLIGASHGLKGSAMIIDSDYYSNKHSSLLNIDTGWQLLGNDISNEIFLPSANPEFKNLAKKLSLEKLSLAQEIYSTE